MVLGTVPERRRMEEQARTVGGALSLIDDILPAGQGVGVPDAAAGDPLTTASWVTVPDVGAVMAAMADRLAQETATRERTELPAVAESLRPRLPRIRTPYDVTEFAGRFEALVRSIEVAGRLGRLDEARELANLGAAFVLDGQPPQPETWISELAGNLYWSIASATARDSYYHQALDHYMAAGAAMRRAGLPSGTRRDHALWVTDLCLGLLEHRVPPRRRLIDLATTCLAEIGRAHAAERPVVRVTFAVARAAEDRAKLAELADPGFAGQEALTVGELRMAQALARMAGPADWKRVFGPFAAPIYAWCADVPHADAFTVFGELGTDEGLPTAGAGFQAVQAGQVTFAEDGCDEPGTRGRRWVGRAAGQPDGGEDAYFVDGVRRPVRCAVPTAGMNSLARFARREDDEVPASVRFLFALGRACASDPSIGCQIDAMLRFFRGLDESVASEACGAILIGAVLDMLPLSTLGGYIAHLETGADHATALRRAVRRVPVAPVATVPVSSS